MWIKICQNLIRKTSFKAYICNSDKKCVIKQQAKAFANMATIRLKAFIMAKQNALAFFTIHDDQVPKVESNEYLQLQHQIFLAKLTLEEIW